MPKPLYYTQRLYIYNMLNVLSLVSYRFLPPKMGGQKGIAFFYDYLAVHVNLTCVTTKENDPSAVSNYEVLNILSNSGLRYIDIFYFFTLRKIIREKKITHLIIEHPYYGWLGVLLKCFYKIKLVVHSHNIEALRFKSTGRWWWGVLWQYEKYTHQQADANFFIHDDDRNFAVEKFKLAAGKCETITYGFELQNLPAPEEKILAKNNLCKQYQVDADTKLLLFNGTLDYKPNLDAVDIILQHINPLLLSNDHFKYKIIICGKGLPSRYDELKSFASKNIIYAGFVDDINIYFKGADIFINPVTDGGGIKTKVVEALGYGLSVISTQSGATGVPIGITGDKLKIIADKDWDEFAKQASVLNTASTIPKNFFDHFYWGNIAGKASAFINRI